jgi:hypothetical protein
MIVSLSRRFTFVHIHKTGGTSVERALEPFLSWYDVILGSTGFGEKINEPYRRQFNLDKHSSVADIETVCGPEYVDDFYLFALVRHPVARLYSLYNFVAAIVLNWAKNQRVDPSALRTHMTPQLLKQFPALNWPASRAFVAGSSFPDFIRNPSLKQDKAFHTQASRLRSGITGDLKGDILKLEAWETWLPHVRSRLAVDFELPHANRSERLVSAADLSKNDLAYIEAEFEEDFRLFGY